MGLTADYHFQLIVVEMLCPINESASHFLTILAKKISEFLVDERENFFYFSAFLF